MNMFARIHCDLRKRTPYQMSQIPLRVFSEPIPDEHPNHTYSLQSRSLDFLESKTKVVTAAVKCCIHIVVEKQTVALESKVI